MELSNWIAEHRLKQAEAAEILMVSRPHVSDVVNQKNASPLVGLDGHIVFERDASLTREFQDRAI